MRIKFLFFLLILIFSACKEQETPEDTLLMKMAAKDQEVRNISFVSSMKAQLEFYGAPGNEASYYRNSGNLRILVDELLRSENSDGILALTDSLDKRMAFLEGEGARDIIENEWTASQEDLKNYYRAELEKSNDSLTYYQLLYIVMKKEHALHMFNARMMAH